MGNPSSILVGFHDPKSDVAIGAGQVSAICCLFDREGHFLKLMCLLAEVFHVRGTPFDHRIKKNRGFIDASYWTLLKSVEKSHVLKNIISSFSDRKSGRKAHILKDIVLSFYSRKRCKQVKSDFSPFKRPKWTGIFKLKIWNETGACGTTFLGILGVFNVGI